MAVMALDKTFLVSEKIMSKKMLDVQHLFGVYMKCYDIEVVMLFYRPGVPQEHGHLCVHNPGLCHCR